MQSAIIVDAALLVDVLKADPGRHRNIGTFRLVSPAGMAVAMLLTRTVAMASRAHHVNPRRFGGVVRRLESV